jgi:hypothetical protein
MGGPFAFFAFHEDDPGFYVVGVAMRNYLLA